MTSDGELLNLSRGKGMEGGLGKKLTLDLRSTAGSFNEGSSLGDEGGGVAEAIVVNDGRAAGVRESGEETLEIAYQTKLKIEDMFGVVKAKLTFQAQSGMRSIWAEAPTAAAAARMTVENFILNVVVVVG